MAGIEKAYLEPEKGRKIPCLFNPTSLTISKANVWETPNAPRQDAPNLVFDYGESGKLEMDLQLDTTDSGKSVTVHTDDILKLMKVDSSLPDNRDSQTKAGRPPWVRFRWGRTHSFKAVITSADIKFTYFSSEGRPLRATVGLKLLQYEDESKWPLQNPTSETPEPHRVHVIRAGETLDRIAHQHYGDPEQWKVIARANHIIDPLSLVTGVRLQIPQQEAASRA